MSYKYKNEGRFPVIITINNKLVIIEPGEIVQTNLKQFCEPFLTEISAPIIEKKMGRPRKIKEDE